MPIIPVYVVPGVCKSTTAYSAGKMQGIGASRMASGRVTDCDKVRWVAGFPEKIGGWVNTMVGPMVGVPRASKQWRSLTTLSLEGIGTENHLYVYDGTTLTDITPLRMIVTGTLANPITTTIGSTTVAITDAGNKLQDGDRVYLAAASPVGGVTVLGWYTVSGRSGAGYNITVPTAATSSAGPGGGTTSYSYPRTTLGADPFATVSGSNAVTVTHATHGAAAGDFVVFSGASAFNNVTISGEYQIQTVPTANTYTITAATTANATGAGGGAAVSVIYLIEVPLYGTALTPIVYGSGTYGNNPYGYGPFAQLAGVPGWTLAAYGSQLLANPIGGTIYVYDPAVGGRAYPLLNAPAVVSAIIVTPERFVVALGCTATGQTTNPLRIAWADQTDYTVWTATPTNTANEGRILQGGSYFVGGTPDVNGASLIHTNRCTFEMLYTGDAQVYNTPVQSDNAGLISPWAIVAQGGVVSWMSDREFWTWNGSVIAMPSDDIRDYVFDNLNRPYAGKCFAGLNRAHREVWFFYPSQASTEVDSYVVWSIAQQCWTIGTMARTTWHDSELFPSPMACDASGYLYQQETGTDAAGVAMAATMTFSPADISNGALNMDVFGFIPDFQEQTGNVTISILTAQYPEDTYTTDGPYTLADNDTTPRIDLRSEGKLAGFSMASNVLGGNFRLAAIRFDVQQAGARR